MMMSSLRQAAKVAKIQAVRFPHPATTTSFTGRMMFSSSTRSLSTARDKLRGVMEDYRKKNYGQELPSRFAKEVTKAADVDGDGYISVAEVEQLLENIGAKDALSAEEIETVMEEMGSKEGPKGVAVKDVVDYVKQNAKPGVS